MGINKLPPYQTQQGDHIVNLKIQIPTKLTDTQRKLFEELANVFNQYIYPSSRNEYILMTPNPKLMQVIHRKVKVYLISLKKCLINNEKFLYNLHIDSHLKCSLLH